MAVYESREALEAVLIRMAELGLADEDLLENIQGTTITIGFKLSDVDLYYVLSLHEGQVEGVLDRPAEAPSLEIGMNSEVMHSVLSGQLHPIKAAMTGALSFSGDLAMAMRFQELLPDFMRLYQKARIEPA